MSIIDLNVGNFFKYYIFNNYSTSLSEQNKKICRVAAIAFGILTAGIGLIIVGLCFYEKDYEIKLMAQTSNTSPLFNSTFAQLTTNNDSSVSSTSPNLFQTTSSPTVSVGDLTNAHSPEKAFNKMKAIKNVYLHSFNLIQLRGCLRNCKYDLNTLDFSTANQGQLLNAIYDLNITSFEHYTPTVEKITRRWEELEANGQIAPYFSGFTDGLFLTVNFESLTTEKQGLSAEILYNNKNSFEVRSLVQMIVNWVIGNNKRMDKLWNQGELANRLWSREELANKLCISQYDLDNLCMYLQILQSEIPTCILNYYFRAILCAINNSESHNNFGGVESIQNLTEGHSVLANGKLRFPGLKYKEVWGLKELARYLAIDEDYLRNELKDILDDKISTEKLLFNLPKLYYISKYVRTQQNTIRFARYGIDFNIFVSQITISGTSYEIYI